MEPALLLPSPQEMVAVKSEAVLPTLASVKEATEPTKVLPSVALIVVPVACKAASVTAAVVLALADDPPASVICTLTEYVPSSA